MMALSLSPLTMALIGVCVVIEPALELGFKHSVNGASPTRSLAASLTRSPIFWATIGLGGVQLLTWVMVLQHAPLSTAYPAMTLAYVTVPIAGYIFLRERMRPVQILGAVLIALGVACVDFLSV